MYQKLLQIIVIYNAICAQDDTIVVGTELAVIRMLEIF
jgi:hypothetical protein